MEGVLISQRPLDSRVSLPVNRPQVLVAVAERIISPKDNVLGVDFVRKHQAP
jgi:hypothetical protein